MLSVIALAKVAVLAAAIATAPAAHAAPIAPAAHTTLAANTPGAEALPAADVLETIRPVALNNGLCWSANDYAQGAQVFETDCGSAHFFVYDLTSTRMYLSGHYTTSLADYGGTFAFRNEPTTGMNSDAVKYDAAGNAYYEMTVGVQTSGTHVHSNGGNHYLGILQGNNGNGALFYWLSQV